MPPTAPAPNPNLLSDARHLRPAALTALLADHYPLVHRMATGLTGRDDVARGVVRWVFSQSLRSVESWKTDDAPQHWFLHHTVLTARRAQKHQPTPDTDTLLGPPPYDTGYLAFLRALRSLPHQQKEAYLLTYAEHLDPRRRGIAMDCSTSAAEAHLHAATATLAAIAPDHISAYTDRLARTYQSLTPTESIAIPRIQSQIHRHLWPRRIAKIAELTTYAAAAYALYRLYPLLDW